MKQLNTNPRRKYKHSLTYLQEFLTLKNERDYFEHRKCIVWSPEVDCDYEFNLDFDVWEDLRDFYENPLFLEEVTKDLEYFFLKELLKVSLEMSSFAKKQEELLLNEVPKIAKRFGYVESNFKDVDFLWNSDVVSCFETRLKWEQKAYENSLKDDDDFAFLRQKLSKEKKEKAEADLETVSTLRHIAFLQKTILKTRLEHFYCKIQECAVIVADFEKLSANFYQDLEKHGITTFSEDLA